MIIHKSSETFTVDHFISANQFCFPSKMKDVHHGYMPKILFYRKKRKF